MAGTCLAAGPAPLALPSMTGRARSWCVALRSSPARCSGLRTATMCALPRTTTTSFSSKCGRIGCIKHAHTILTERYFRSVILSFMTLALPPNRYSAEAVSNAREKKEGVTEDGIEDAFDLVGEVSWERQAAIPLWELFVFKEIEIE